MKKEEKASQHSKMKRPSVVLTPEEYKAVAHYCIDHDMKMGEFIKQAALYCAEKGITFREK